MDANVIIESLLDRVRSLTKEVVFKEAQIKELERVIASERTSGISEGSE